MSINTSLASVNLSLTQSKHDRLLRSVRKGWTPPPRISVPDWADRYRKLAKEAGSTSGNWETTTVEIARGPMLAATESGVHIITVMCCTQLMKTALLENLFGYFAHLDPCPMLLLQPKEDAAEQFSKERITPLVRVTPVLRQLVGGNKQKNSKETLLYKSFTGGFLALAGAGSPDNLARRPIRVLLADEVDKYPITREGDPITLAEERTATFGLNWLSVRACSPTVEDESRIAASYEESDQRRASIACPHCGHRQFPDFFKHVHWPSDGDKHNTKLAMIHCESCGSGWSEGDRLRALNTIEWHQTKPFECCEQRHVPLNDYEQAWHVDDQTALGVVWRWSESERHAVHRAVCPTCGKLGVDNIHAGFQASKMFSPWQKDKPSDIAAKYLKAKGDPDKELAWWNTQMGLPHRPNYGKRLPVDELLARREIFDAEVPDGVAVLTAGIDTQSDRLEIEVVGWGKDEESWSVAFDVIEGDLETAEPGFGLMLISSKSGGGLMAVVLPSWPPVMTQAATIHKRSMSLPRSGLGVGYGPSKGNQLPAVNAPQFGPTSDPHQRIGRSSAQSLLVLTQQKILFVPVFILISLVPVICTFQLIGIWGISASSQLND